MIELSTKIMNIVKPLTIFATSPVKQKQLPEVFYDKDVLKSFAKFTEKHLRPEMLLKRDSGTGVFCEFCKKTPNVSSEYHFKNI